MSVHQIIFKYTFPVLHIILQECIFKPEFHTFNAIFSGNKDDNIHKNEAQ